MKFILSFLAAMIALAAPATAQVISSDQASGKPAVVQCTASDGRRVICPAYTPVRTDGTVIDPAGGGTGATAQQVQGTAAGNSTPIGNPVQIGYVRTSSGFIRAATGDTTDLDSVGTGAAGFNVRGFGFVFDGTAWQRQRGDLTGMYVVGKGGGSINTGQIAVSTTSTLIAAARTGRQKIGLTVVGAVQCAFGNSGVTLATGWPLAAVAYAADQWDTAAAIYAVCASSTTVAYREQF